MRSRPQLQVAIAGCHGGASSSDVALDGASSGPDVPFVTVEEYHLHGVQPPTPTIAIWDDGQIVFAGTRDGEPQLLVAETSRANAAALARSAYRTLDAVPRLTKVLDWTGGTLLRVTVRDGNRWRSASVYGDDPERVLAVARGTNKRQPVDADPRGVRQGLEIVEAMAERPWAHLGFAKT